jgi:hypothetical protein
MADPLSDQALAELEARCEQMLAVNERLRRTGPAGSPHISPAVVALWIDELCSKDIPVLLDEIRRLRREHAYLCSLLAAGGGDESLRAALTKIAHTSWKTWFADEAATQMVHEARLALGESDAATTPRSRGGAGAPPST